MTKFERMISTTAIALLILVIVLLVSLGTVLAQVNIEGKNGMDEDDVIICVNDSDGIPDNGFICHLYNTDDVDWYQDAYDGTFFNRSDSFNASFTD